MSTETNGESRTAVSQADGSQIVGQPTNGPQTDDLPARGPLLAQLQTRLDQIAGEFKDLGEELRGLIGQILVLDAKMALARARMTLELLMRDVYQRRLQAPAGRRALDELISTLAKHDQIPRHVQANAQMVRILGNAGPHAGYKVNLDEVESAVQQLLPVVDWYVEASRSGVLDIPTDRPLGESSGTKQRSEPRALGIVPKGLRSFDASDREFFLQLLPGPRYDEGLPESLRFWKDRIETTGEVPFEVGVIYGPSGCGKSSLVKAGLLPNLDQQRVRSLYLEASIDDTEARLLNTLRKRFPALPHDLDLTATIEALCQGKGFHKNKRQKVFIVLDQFEQWLHAHRGEQNTELARALRQCDGERVQTLLMVREDFLGDASRFLDDLNIVLSRSQNTARVDLFDLPHARNVLAAFGMAYGQVTEKLTAEQEAFIEQAVEGLSEDRRVVCVRLALFAEMFRERPWSLKTLELVGGTVGVGTTFLEETFSASTAQEQRRRHQQAARAVFKALLPEEGTDIKGQKRSVSELRADCGYENRPEDFAELMGILNTDLRLISPARQAADGDEIDEEHANSPAPDRAYQLTHDFLVPALREWLDRKQQETRRGRAGLLIARRASMWKGKQEARFLPSAREYLVIRTLTDERSWTPIQRAMIERARRVHLRHGAEVVVCLAMLGFVALVVWNRVMDGQQAQAAAGLVETLKNDDMANVGDTVEQLRPYLQWAGPILKDARLNAGSDGEKLKASLALAALGVDTSDHQIKYLNDSMMNAEPAVFPTLCKLLSPFADKLDDGLWAVLENRDAAAMNRFQAACALAAYVPKDQAASIARWKKYARFVADYLVKTIAQTNNGAVYVDQLSPRQVELIDPLSAIYRDATRPASEHVATTSILAQYGKAAPDKLVGLIADAGADPNSFVKLYESLTAGGEQPVKLMASQLQQPLAPTAKDAEREAYASHVANAAVALIKLRHPEEVWPLMGHPTVATDPVCQTYPRVRSYIIHRIAPLGGDPHLLIDRMGHEPDAATLEALILTLGEFTKDKLPDDARKPIVEKLTTLYRQSPESGLRGAAEWLLRNWGQEAQLSQIDHDLSDKHPDGQSWYVNSVGQTMVVVHAPGKVQLGSSPTEPNRDSGNVEALHTVPIDYSFAIAAHEVTVGDLAASTVHYKPDAKYVAQAADNSVDKRCPANQVTWYQAAEYCNWLSKKESLAECYQPNEDGAFAAGMQPYDDYLKRDGYRLPTEAEWECASRAGTGTSRYYGQTDDLLTKYAWFATDSSNHLWPIGQLKPNDWGLFDTLGNALEWCEDYCHDDDPDFAGKTDAAPVQNGQIRIARGEKFLSDMPNVRVARRDRKHGPEKADFIMGFRPARTYPESH
jgi:formylglycine-generating enzyme required for sulfatase activity